MNKNITKYILKFGITYIFYPIIYPLLKMSLSTFFYVKSVLYNNNSNEIKFVKKHDHHYEYKIYIKDTDKVYDVYLLEEYCDKKYDNVLDSVLNKSNDIYHAYLVNMCDKCENCDICKNSSNKLCDSCTECELDHIIFSDLTSDIKKYIYYIDKIVEKENNRTCKTTHYISKSLWFEIMKLINTRLLENQPKKEKSLVLMLYLNQQDSNDVHKLKIKLN